MLTLKLNRIGNSVGVIFPKEMLAKMHSKEGDTLFVTETVDGYTLTPYDLDFIKQMQMARDIMEENKEVLRILAE